MILRFYNALGGAVPKAVLWVAFEIEAAYIVDLKEERTQG